ncbi:HAD family hydrolase [Deinococcus sp.]|uniref:HAD family hydrolase n=1 Tax=Deinococcus sp. TaxID=47478 RepID=UPI0028698D09|nr:HAD family hydrolase [Deinococcus sp.]
MTLPLRPFLVLDLDETLWYGVEAVNDEPVRFHLRPHLTRFLEQVAHDYDLAVWTAASGDWMHHGLEVLRAGTGFDLAGRAVFLWDRTRCSWRRGEDGELLWRKPVRKFRAGWMRARYPRGRILAVDDVPGNYVCGYGHLVRVTPWTGDASDTELLHLAAYLRSIVQAEDFRVLEKRGWRSRPRPSESQANPSCPGRARNSCHAARRRKAASGRRAGSRVKGNLR